MLRLEDRVIHMHMLLYSWSKVPAAKQWIYIFNLLFLSRALINSPSVAVNSVGEKEASVSAPGEEASSGRQRTPEMVKSERLQRLPGKNVVHKQPNSIIRPAPRVCLESIHDYFPGNRYKVCKEFTYNVPGEMWSHLTSVKISGNKCFFLWEKRSD